MNGVASGFTGLFLFFSNWFLSGEKATLNLGTVIESDSIAFVEYSIAMKWHEEGTALIGAGIPLTVTHKITAQDRELFWCRRVLTANTVSEKFVVISNYSDGYEVKKEYPNIYLSLSAFKKVTAPIPITVKKATITMDVESAYVSELNKTIDMSPLVGSKHLTLIYKRTK